MNNSLWTTGPFKGTNWPSTCSKCCKVMTPEDSTICPELFLHDNCVPFVLLKALKEKEDPLMLPIQKQILQF